MAQIRETADLDELDPALLTSIEPSLPHQITAQYQTIVRFQGGTYFMLGLTLVAGTVALMQSSTQTDPSARVGLPVVALAIILFPLFYFLNLLNTPPFPV